jgi:GntR family carbon starvation induced transcriptional regulator
MNGPDPSTLAAFAFERLRADLKANKFAPGERLRTDELKETYRVGLSPLREALTRLTEIGLVTQIGQRGFRVADVSLADLTHIVEARRFFEARALAASIAEGNEEWEANLVAAFHRLSKASRAGMSREHYNAWEQHHAAFHSALLAGCSNAWLLRNWQIMFDQAERYRRLADMSKDWFDGQIPEHKELLEAAISRDVGRACTLLVQHIGRSSERLGPRLERVLQPTALEDRELRQSSKTQKRLMSLIGRGENT